MVGFGINPANSFQGQSIGNEIGSVQFCRGILDGKITICSYLVRLINGLNNDSYTSFIMRIFSIVTIQVSNSLLSSMFLLNPIFNESLNLINIHKLNVINVSVLLSFDDDIGRNTFVTHGFRVRFMILASCVNLVPNLRWRQAVVTFYIAWMDSFTFEFLLLQKVIERNVSCV